MLMNDEWIWNTIIVIEDNKDWRQELSYIPVDFKIHFEMVNDKKKSNIVTACFY